MHMVELEQSKVYSPSLWVFEAQELSLLISNHFLCFSISLSLHLGFAQALNLSVSFAIKVYGHCHLVRVRGCLLYTRDVKKWCWNGQLHADMHPILNLKTRTTCLQVQGDAERTGPQE